MTELEQAAIKVHLAFWGKVGPTADWAVRLEGDREERKKIAEAIDQLDQAVFNAAEKFGSVPT